MLLLLSLAACAAIALADSIPLAPSPPVDPETQQRLDLHQIELHERAAIEGQKRVTFRSKWVTQKAIFDTRPSGDAIQIEVTDTTTETALKIGAETVLGVVKYMHPSIFATISRNQVSLGIFSYKDAGGVTVFPEFANLRDRPECKGTCAGRCANTCTGDGRKYETLGGLATTTVAAVHEDTVLCNSRDPYYGKLNVAVHEFAHSVHMGLSYMTSPYNGKQIGSQIKSAHTNAYNSRIWEMQSYAMSNEYEYFAEGVGTYLDVNDYSSAGGMNKCDGYNVGSCKDENAARYRLYTKDPLLYNVITEVIVNLDPNTKSGLKTCMTK
jgi:hypothetical protein